LEYNKKILIGLRSEDYQHTNDTNTNPIIRHCYFSPVHTTVTILQPLSNYAAWQWWHVHVSNRQLLQFLLIIENNETSLTLELQLYKNNSIRCYFI